MLNSNTEFYEVVKYIIHELNQMGFEEEAIDLKNALEISVQPGEIFGETRLVLKLIAKKKISNKEVQKNINHCIKYLNKIL